MTSQPTAIGPRRMRRLGALTAGLMLAAGVLLAALPAQAATDWDGTLAAARHEGQVVVYSAYIGASYEPEIAKALKERFGITISWLEGRASELRERIRIEQAAGRFAGDVHLNSMGQLSLMHGDGLLQSPGALPNLPQVRPALRGDAMAVPSFTLDYGILINTGLVKPAQEPKSWLDLLAPEWTGKILADDPRAVGGGYSFFTATLDRFGRGYEEKLAAQHPVFTRDPAASERRVVRGEAAIWVPMILSDAAGLAGLPVKAIVPREGAVYVLYAAGMLKNAPHPNAARVLMNFLISDEAQTIFARHAHGAVVDGIADKLPPDQRRLTDVTLLGTSDVTRQSQVLGLAKEIFK